ncbi:MAG: hypothetical protein GY940_17060, partial [bacterium]|nr:hypothetical protein [bacterium]
RTALEEGHSGLYRYTPKKEIDGLFETLSSQLTQPLTESEFYARLLLIVGAINDGHTRLNTSATHSQWLETERLIFPFNLRFIKRKAYLFRNYSENTNVPMGSQLVSINGHPLEKMVKAFFPLISSDAHIMTSKFRQMESTSHFGNLYMAVYGRTDSFSVNYMPFGKKGNKTIKVKGIGTDDIMPLLYKRYPEEERKREQRKLHTLEYKNGIPVLTIKGFRGGSYPGFLAKSFRELKEKNAKHLIIDLRRNGGGSDVYGRMLAAYLMDKPFGYYKSLTSKATTLSVSKYTNLSESDWNRRDRQTRKNASGWYDVSHPNLGTQQPIQPGFTGKVWVLIDGGSFSATGEATSVMHFHKKAVFVGLECGAGYYGNTSGFVPRLTLPNTGIRLNIPMVRYTMDVSGYPKDRGLIPDHEVIPTIQDLLNDKDVQMEFIINKIKN